MRRVDLVVMSGWGDGTATQMLGGAQRAITLDIIDRALAGGVFGSVIVSTNDPVLARALTGARVSVELDPDDEPFHFGKRLQYLVSKFSIERLVYMGGASAPLLPAGVLCDLAERIRSADRLLVVNNFYSVDFCAFTPASALLSAPPPLTDNELGWLLSETAGLPAEELPRTAATTFDIDTPTDLMALSLHADVPRRTREYLDELCLDTRRVESAIRVFVDRQAEALVAGRVGSRTLAYLEREAACRTRVLSEERGMRADGRLARGEVRSALAMLMDAVGVDRFFQTVLPELGDAAFLDDRALWAHFGVWPPAQDRFCSDLFQSERISDNFVRRFTEAAASCPVPLVLGGHSLVSGAMYVLVEAAWSHSGVDLAPPVVAPS